METWAFSFYWTYRRLLVSRDVRGKLRAIGIYEMKMVMVGHQIKGVHF